MYLVVNTFVNSKRCVKVVFRYWNLSGSVCGSLARLNVSGGCNVVDGTGGISRYQLCSVFVVIKISFVQFLEGSLTNVFFEEFQFS